MSSPQTKGSAGSMPKKGATAANSRVRSRAAVGRENPRLAALKRRHFTKKGRAARIAGARQAFAEIERIGSTFKLDNETLKRLAENPDLEYV